MGAMGDDYIIVQKAKVMYLMFIFLHL